MTTDTVTFAKAPADLLAQYRGPYGRWRKVPPHDWIGSTSADGDRFKLLSFEFYESHGYTDSRAWDLVASYPIEDVRWKELDSKWREQ